MTMYKIQTAPIPDAVVDGEVLTRLPYPLIVGPNGEIHGSVLYTAVIGFVQDPKREAVDMPWAGLFVAGRPIYQVVGTYVIVQDRKGRWATLATAVESFTPVDSLTDVLPTRTQKERDGVHETHCCTRHGCKYGDADCPVKAGRIKQAYECEQCDEDAGNQPVTLAQLRKLLADFAAEVETDVTLERLDWGAGTERAFKKLAERLGIRR